MYILFRVCLGFYESINSFTVSRLVLIRQMFRLPARYDGCVTGYKLLKYKSNQGTQP